MKTHFRYEIWGMVSEQKVLQGALICGGYMHQQSQQKNGTNTTNCFSPEIKLFDRL